MKSIVNLSVFTILFVCCSYIGNCQPVNGVRMLDSVKSYFERNYVGFADKVTPATQDLYEAYTRQVYTMAKSATTKSECFAAIKLWLNFFKDEHVYINIPSDTTATRRRKAGEAKLLLYKPLFPEENQVNAFYKKLNDSTGYLRVKSFDLHYAHGIDSVIKANVQSIQTMPRLVLDLRWNGGGGDYSTGFLQPVVYTNPIKCIGDDLLVTPDNITAWENMINRYRAVMPQKNLDRIRQLLEQGRGKDRTWVNFAPDINGVLPTVWPMPEKVAIVIDQGCGSTTEEFLLAARQSKKVVIAGEPSKGVLDYSNVVEKDFVNPDFELHYPTTRSRRLDVGLGIDNVGIQPDLPLDLSAYNNWLNELLIKW